MIGGSTRRESSPLAPLIHTQPTNLMAAAAAETTLSGSDLRGPRIQLVVAAGARLLVLRVAATPRVQAAGPHSYGWSKQREGRRASPAVDEAPRGWPPAFRGGISWPSCSVEAGVYSTPKRISSTGTIWL